jgi:hypothetical protein
MREFWYSGTHERGALIKKKEKTKKKIHLCDVCFNNLKNIDELKKVLPRIIVSSGANRPYYEILYWNGNAKQYCIGYSSYDLETVQQYMKRHFGGDE